MIRSTEMKKGKFIKHSSAIVVALLAVSPVATFATANGLTTTVKADTKAGSSEDNPIKLTIKIDKAKFNKAAMNGITFSINSYLHIYQDGKELSIDPQQIIEEHSAPTVVKGTKVTLRKVGCKLAAKTWYEIRDASGLDHLIKTPSNSYDFLIPINYTFIAGSEKDHVDPSLPNGGTNTKETAINLTWGLDASSCMQVILDFHILTNLIKICI